MVVGVATISWTLVGSRDRCGGRARPTGRAGRGFSRARRRRGRWLAFTHRPGNERVVAQIADPGEVETRVDAMELGEVRDPTQIRTLDFLGRRVIRLPGRSPRRVRDDDRPARPLRRSHHPQRRQLRLEGSRPPEGAERRRGDGTHSEGVKIQLSLTASGSQSYRRSALPMRQEAWT